MKRTLKNIVLGSILAGAFIMNQSCVEENSKESKKDNRLPNVTKNQSLILHPDYINGKAILGYTLLTDMDQNGNWDAAERYHAGFTAGDSSHKLYFKKGFGPAQSVDAEFELVEPGFFNKYE